MPSAPSVFAETVAFIYRTFDGARRDTGFCAVGFIASVRSTVRSTERYYYIVTNEHVVSEFDNVIVRLNSLPYGFKVISIPRGKFQRDRALDLAIAALPKDSEMSFMHVSEDASIKPETLNALKIGYGTDLFMVSRIVRKGVRYTQRNVSVMRFGNIAMVPQNEETLFLAEMRSIAGHSGSPVFVYSTPFIFGNPRKQEEDFAPMLLGINRGHLEESAEIFRVVNGEESKHPFYRSITNMGISQVVPAWHIFKMLNDKKFKQQRQKADGKLEPLARFVEDVPRQSSQPSTPQKLKD